MSLKAYNIDVPITPGVMPPVIHIGQYDSGREYIAHLKNDDGTDYIIPANATATFTGCNPRKEVFEIECNITNNAVIFVPQDEATSMWGLYGATINITSGGEKLSPLVIKMDVQKAGATDAEIAGAANFPDAVTTAVDNWLEENIEEGQLGDLFVPQAPQAVKTDEMTQPVGMDENGKLWTTPGGGSGAVTPASIVTATSQMNTTQRNDTRSNINAAPSTNIQKSALASAVQTSLGKADTAVQPADLAAYVPRGQQATKTSGQTQAVGIDANGKLWVEPPGSGGGGTVERFNVHITDTGNGYVSDKSFTQISVADAAGQIIVPSYNYFEGRVIKLTDSYAIVSIVDLSLPQIPILWTFTITDTGTNGYGTDIGGAAYIYLTKNGDDYDLDLNNTPEILRTRGNVLNYFYDGIAVKMMVNGYAHPLVYHYGDGILKFGGPEYSVVNGHHVQQDIVYTWSASSHIAREVVTPLNADMLTAKTSAMTQPVGYDANTGTLWTIPGEGGTKLLTMQQSGSGYTLTGANFDFTTLADLQAMCQAGTILWLVNTTTGSVYKSVNTRGVNTTARLTFAGLTKEGDSDPLVVDAFTLNGQMQITHTRGMVAPEPEAQDDGKILLTGPSGLYWGVPDIGGTGGLTYAQAVAFLAAIGQCICADAEDGQAAYNALYDTLFPQQLPAEIVSIDARFVQGQNVILDTASLNDLKSMLHVIATYDDDSTGNVADYTLSGTLTAGTSTITVTAGSLTDTFTVTVSHNLVDAAALAGKTGKDGYYITGSGAEQTGADTSYVIWPITITPGHIYAIYGHAMDVVRQGNVYWFDANDNLLGYKAFYDPDHGDIYVQAPVGAAKIGMSYKTSANDLSSWVILDWPKQNLFDAANATSTSGRLSSEGVLIPDTDYAHTTMGVALIAGIRYHFNGWLTARNSNMIEGVYFETASGAMVAQELTDNLRSMNLTVPNGATKCDLQYATGMSLEHIIIVETGVL